MKKKVGKALVVGAGISGIRAALDLAEFGYGVTLIDRAPNMGGILSQLDYQFPTDRCGMCKMLPLVDRDSASQYCLRKGMFHENIEILLSTELYSVEGEPGNFQVTLKQKHSWVDPELCIGCGDCLPVCPVEVPDAFNTGLIPRKAIYLPVPHAIPNPYVIDMTVCTQCGSCEEICPTHAIRLSQQERKKFRILVVDDELIIRESLKEWLEEEAGFTVDTAESGPAAIDKLSKQPFQLILLDIKMPGMDGVEVLKRTKEDFPEVHVVMMTAYATIETAVEAMKIGAIDYLIKPFDPQNLIPKILSIYEDVEAAEGKKLEVGAIVLCGGTAYFDPASGIDTHGYAKYPNVVTSLEFERIMSGTGPFQGRLVRPDDGKPIRRIAWIQCVGSRDLQIDADFCSNICCMYAIKEALIAKEKTNGQMDTTIFYMDMRTFGKNFQRYRDQAETEKGVRFERGRVHSVVQDENSGDLVIQYVDPTGTVCDKNFDMVVLAVGQRPSPGTEALAEMTGIPLNPWGFCRSEPFSLNQTEQRGIVLGGAFSGLKDISDSVIQASSAALSASHVIHSAGGGLIPEPVSVPEAVDISRELPRILVAICTCGNTLSEFFGKGLLAKRLESDPDVDQVVFLEQTCTAAGWEKLPELLETHKPNRLLIGACLPYVYAKKMRELGRKMGMIPSLMDAVDVRTPAFRDPEKAGPADTESVSALIESRLRMSIARLKRANPLPVATIQIRQNALVVGGGIAGMTAALAIANHGFPVDIVELKEQLGGNLNWLQETIEGFSTQTLIDETREKIEKHPNIRVHTQTQVMGSYGQVGRFFTSIENADGDANTLEHGVTLLATGGTEAVTTAYSYEKSEAIVTQKELEQKIENKTIDPGQLNSVVMIQCVDSREEPRNYCSRICCTSALKHALYLKSQNPGIDVYILYRDIMSYGFSETYYTQARKAGVTFIQYTVDEKPLVNATESDKPVQVTTLDPILGRQINIDADLVVLATGVVPSLPRDLALGFGASVDEDGFFQEADSKWRPVDSLKEGVFACGLALSPRSISESIATAEASAQRALRILWQKELPAGKVVAVVRHSLCSLCERCIDACPYDARTIESDLEQVVVNPAMCQGCGSCATVCPNSASVLEGFPEQQMLDIIDAALF